LVGSLPAEEGTGRRHGAWRVWPPPPARRTVGSEGARVASGRNLGGGGNRKRGGRRGEWRPTATGMVRGREAGGILSLCGTEKTDATGEK
jgi:hypothetical protein